MFYDISYPLGYEYLFISISFMVKICSLLSFIGFSRFILIWKLLKELLRIWKRNYQIFVKRFKEKQVVPKNKFTLTSISYMLNGYRCPIDICDLFYLLTFVKQLQGYCKFDQWLFHNQHVSSLLGKDCNQNLSPFNFSFVSF